MADFRFVVDQSLVDLADRCQRGNPCLGGRESLHCHVSFSVERDEERYLFTECDDEVCSYRLDFGRTHVCTCPVRKEIYRKYGI